MIDPATVAGIVVCLLVWLAAWAYFRRPKAWDPEQGRVRRMTPEEFRELQWRRRKGRIRHPLGAREDRRRPERLIESQRRVRASLEHGGEK